MGHIRRNSNIELLRIISMLFIVAHHFVGQGRYYCNSFTALNYINYILSFAAIIFVNVFLMIGIWYMLGSTFKASRIVSLYAQLFFYTAGITIIVLICDRNSVSISALFRGFFPFLGRALWFASAYITLIFFAPFLNKVLEMEKKQMTILVFLLLFFFSFICTIPGQENNYVCNVIWFCIAYIFMGYYKKYIHNKNKFFNENKRLLFLFISIFIYFGLITFYFWDQHMENLNI